MVSVCLPSCNTYRLTWVSLTLDGGYLFMAAPARRKAERGRLQWGMERRQLRRRREHGREEVPNVRGQETEWERQEISSRKLEIPRELFMQKKKESEIAQSCPTLCDPMDCSLPGSSAHGIFQARVLELPFPFPGDLPDPGKEPRSPTL